MPRGKGTIDQAQTRTNMMTRRLKSVEALPVGRAQTLLGVQEPDNDSDDEVEDDPPVPR